MEEWYLIDGTDNKYSINKLGQIKTNSNGNIRLGDITSQGYLEVRVRVGALAKMTYRKLVHIILAEMFLEKPTEAGDWVVDHVDNNRCNNRLDNLQWLTRVENFARAISYRSKINTQVAVNQYDLEGNFIATYPAINQALKALGKDPCSPIIGYACRGRCSTNKCNTAYGYQWRFVDDDDIVRPPQ